MHHSENEDLLDRSEIELLLEGSREIDRMKKETAEIEGLLTSFAIRVLETNGALFEILKTNSQELIHLSEVNRTLLLHVTSNPKRTGPFTDRISSTHCVRVYPVTGDNAPDSFEPGFHVKYVTAKYEALPRILERFKEIFPGIEKHIMPVTALGEKG